MDIKNYISSGIIELYVMGLCSPEEEREFEMLRQQHPELHEAILRYESDMEKNMLQKGVFPGAEVDDKILQRLESLNTPFVPIKAGKALVKKMYWLKPVAAAVLLLLGVSLFFNYQLSKKNKLQAEMIKGTKNISLPLSDYAVITNPSITPVGMYGVGSHAICRCTMFWDKKTGKAYIMIHHLPKSSSSRDYQLWAEVDGKLVSVGIINDEIRGRFIEVPDVPAGAVAFSVTLEKTGGSITPTVDETYLKGRI
ncbi:MAG: anti-sigma factor [Sphingobacteriales bacterium]|nr:anti-sigma factor [Sphingobacteriales bacterium]